nr:ABC transporter ATP-binding protein [Mycoavidus sp. B2-EB]
MVRELTLAQGSRTLVAGFTQCFLPGQIWCIAGPNGVGKTTLIENLAGVRQAKQGTIELDGRALSLWSTVALARRRALLPQTLQDIFSSSVFETVLLSRYPYLAGWGWETKQDHLATWAALASWNLTSLATRDVLSLSGGERQRVALAAVLCQQTPLLLLDEPLAYLDLPYQMDCLQRLRSWTGSAQRTLIFSCHDLNLARRFATHALLLDGNGAVYSGPAREILSPILVSRVFQHPFKLLPGVEPEILVPV